MLKREQDKQSNIVTVGGKGLGLKETKEQDDWENCTKCTNI